MRGAYTAGVIESFLEQDFNANYVVGVSAGASNSVSYVSKQRGRSIRCNINYIDDPRYASVKSWITTGSYFGMDYVFGEIPQKIDPFDHEAFHANLCEYEMGVTNIETGKTEFFGKDSFDNDATLLRASCSMPLFSPPIEWKGSLYLDGGVTQPIPLERALEKGCDFVVVVLTQPRGYQKTAQKGISVLNAKFKNYPALVDAMANRHLVYNKELEEVAKLEKQGKVFVIAPSKELEIGRMEKNKDNLRTAARQGYLDGVDALEQLRGILGENFPSKNEQ